MHIIQHGKNEEGITALASSIRDLKNNDPFKLPSRGIVAEGLPTPLGVERNAHGSCSTSAAASTLPLLLFPGAIPAWTPLRRGLARSVSKDNQTNRAAALFPRSTRKQRPDVTTTSSMRAPCSNARALWWSDKL